MAKLRVGVIGAGGIGFGVHSDMQDLKMELVAVCDIEEAKLQRAVEKYQAPNTFTDYNEMLKMKDLDAVTIATPNYLHALAIAALNAENMSCVKTPFHKSRICTANGGCSQQSR